MEDKNTLTMQQLENLFKIAKQEDKDIILELTVPSCEASEFIIVKNANLDYKLNYYKQAYNENLELVRNNEIKILSMKLDVFNV